MSTSTSTKQKRQRRHARIRSTISGTATKPRLAVFRSNKYISAQIIDDTAGATLVAISDKGEKGASKVERAMAAGEKLAKAAAAKNITTVAFDRGGFLYTGRVKALAEGARKGGLQF